MRQLERGRQLELHVKLGFPRDDEEARTQEAAFRRFVEKGGQAKIDGRFIRELVTSDWAERLYGDTKGTPEGLAFESIPSTDSMPIKIEAAQRGQVRAQLDFIELRLTQGGTQEVTLSNEAQARSPVTFTMRVLPSAGDIKIDLAIRSGSMRAADVFTSWLLLDTLAKGGELRITDLRGGKDARWQAPEHVDKAPSDDLIAVIEDLRFLCAQVNGVAEHSLAGAFLSDADCDEIQGLALIVRTGRSSGTANLRTTARRDRLPLLMEGLEKMPSFEIRREMRDAKLDFLGLAIPVGDVIERSRVPVTPELLKAMTVACQSEGETVELKLGEVAFDREYTRWLPAPAPALPPSSDEN
jgi:hypothetical protein